MVARNIRRFIQRQETTKIIISNHQIYGGKKIIGYMEVENDASAIRRGKNNIKHVLYYMIVIIKLAKTIV
ncbi:hypothetical protein A6769_31825 [Nostoc punctiforme NIES-2108]|uniref:Uncharacterized protein n=1 Tax=Nostoc punctiforme NIES-2108 TaxID=1356359 RepID=A0A367R3K3_NOSPU|nr:hypothetical protein A6769_31825 [Nostoc punctiforme NIES-2108]